MADKAEVTLDNNSELQGGLNRDLRRKIVDMCVAGKDGHIPSAFSILDIITHLYKDVLSFDAKKPEWEDRSVSIPDKFITGYGTYEELCTSCGLTADSIVAAALGKD